MYYVYVIRSLVDGKLYKGFTSDLRQRIRSHNKGEVKSTRNRGPFELVYNEKYECKVEALKREKFLKSLQRGKILKDILNNAPR